MRETQQPIRERRRSMNCEKVRDRFSSLWEKELAPFEEKMLKEHLSSCPKCQREFEQFEKTMRWLHSAEEVEVPEGFLPELYKKMEEKKGAIPVKKSGGRWLHFPLSFKLPVQAAAMVAVVFLVLYVTKMAPIDGYRLKETRHPSSPLSVQEKPEEAPAQKEMERERSALETPAETPRPKDTDQAKAPVPTEGKSEEPSAPQVKAEAKKREAPARSAEAVGYQAGDTKEAARMEIPSSEPGKAGRELAVQEKSTVASKPPQEIILRISDREKVISRLHELVKQFGGEVVTTERDIFLASVPTGSFSEFEKELAGLSSSGKTDLLMARKPAAGKLRLEQGAKGEEGGEKSKEPAILAADKAGRTIVRILLVQE
jgi:hypothetical protein